MTGIGTEAVAVAAEAVCVIFIRDLRGGDGKALSRADGICPYSFDGGGGVHENGVSVATLLSLV